jgi:hypothetical protein
MCKLMGLLGVLLPFALLCGTARAGGLNIDYSTISYLENGTPVSLTDHPTLVVKTYNPFRCGGGDPSLQLSYLLFGFIPSFVSDGTNKTVDWFVALDGSKDGTTYGTETLLAQYSAEIDIPEFFYNDIEQAALVVSVHDEHGVNIGSHEFEFSLTQAVPESNSLLLMGTGILGLGFQMKRRGRIATDH